MTRDAPARTALGSWPTPLEPAPRLGAAIGLDHLWVKRDDLVGLGGGGNKVRKLEVSCAAADAAGADVLVTTGAAQSNHARLTAAAAARTGRAAVLVLAGTSDGSGHGLGGSPTGGGNLLLDGLLGAEVVWAGDVDGAALAHRAEQEVERLRSDGRTPYLVPYGGSSPATARAYEVAAQEVVDLLPDVRHTAVAIGSGGTMAGLVSRLGVARVLGVDTGATSDGAATVATLLDEMSVRADGLRVRADQVGTGYARLQPTVWDALRLAATTEALLLDPVYTGRALAGLVAAVRDGDVRRDEPTVLLHTGGLPGLFGHPEAARRAALDLAPAP